MTHHVSVTQLRAGGGGGGGGRLKGPKCFLLFIYFIVEGVDIEGQNEDEQLMGGRWEMWRKC